MFETLVTRLLTNALGNYVDAKCFSSDKINVAVWSGNVVLHELEVKPDVLDHPALRLVRGMCGSIELKIPWNRLQSDSVVAIVDDVYLMVETEADIEAVMVEMNEFTIKKKILESLYAQAKEHQQEEEAADSSENGFAARLINKIIDNVEVSGPIVRLDPRPLSLSGVAYVNVAASHSTDPRAHRRPSHWRPPVCGRRGNRVCPRSGTVLASPLSCRCY